MFCFSLNHLDEVLERKTVTMGISPVELIIGTKSFSSFPNKQAVLQRLLTFECDSNQVRTPLQRTHNPPPSYSMYMFLFVCFLTLILNHFNFQDAVRSYYPPSRMPSQLEGAMDALITVFYNYSGNDGDKYKLNKGELKQLLNSELTDFLTVQ